MTVERVYIGEPSPVSPVPDVIDLTGGPDVVGGPEPVLRLVDTDSSVPGEMFGPTQACRYRSWPLAAKWVLDRSLALVTAVLVLPVLIVIAVIVGLTSSGPVLFAQRRVGREGRHFTIYKFRTMRADAEEYLETHPDLAARHRENDFKLPIAEDVRVTRVGRWLRKSSLDELPQLLNIIRGDMSFVGPRPVVPEELDLYGPYRRMYEAAYPGLTGVWQVAGRDNTRYPARAALDADYVERWTFWGDLGIILRTIPALFDSERTSPK